MKQLTGVLIEYLAIGSSTVFWVLLLIVAFAGLPNEKDHPAIAAMLLPLAYVLGMISDTVGEWAIDKKKQDIKNAMREKSPIAELESHAIHAFIVLHSSELAEESNTRSSRDRIARGILVNVPCIGIATVIYMKRNLHQGLGSISFVLAATIVMTLIVYRMWVKFQEHSYKFEKCAYIALEEKLKMQRHRNVRYITTPDDDSSNSGEESSLASAN